MVSSTTLAQGYTGKRVLLTGHTGFKGSWMALWLTKLGAEVFGMALDPPTTPSLFDLAGLAETVDHYIADVRDAQAVQDRIAAVRPDVIFHMAAQSLVRESYRSPVDTLAVNVMGTAHILEAARQLATPCAIVIVTSDKCYDNREWVWGYRENDRLGGHDPYSMSKGAAELVTESWRASFFHAPDSAIRVASARAGNVIGGGDWAVDRIVTDSIAALARGGSIRLRNPHATRPWQHVLEPLSGYLLLGQHLMGARGTAFAEAWNFGPLTDSIRPVSDLARLLVEAWGSGRWEAAAMPNQPKEAYSLALNCDKAHHQLGWKPSWTIEQAVNATVMWFKAWQAGDNLRAVTYDQIARYEADAAALGFGTVPMPDQG
jgi:CDP-glucose 4,6-dehydratase